MPYGVYFEAGEAMDYINEFISVVPNAPHVDAKLFQKFIDAGEIEKIIPPGRKKQGVYLIEDVKEFAERYKRFLEGNRDAEPPAA
jgi:hypothetical protein